MKVLKGYKYGKSYIPFSKYDEKLMRYSATKIMQLVGFSDSRSVPRHHLLGSVECVCAEPSDQNAAVALSALIHALAGIHSYSSALSFFVVTIRSQKRTAWQSLGT
jgi:ATP-dependent DNA helicase 2 subunit 2